MLTRTRRMVLVAVVASAFGCAGSPSGETVGSESVSCPVSVPAWTPGTTYATGAIVTYQGTTYRCRQGHTALDNWMPDIVPALWEPVTCSTGGGGGGAGGGGSGGGGGGSGGGGSGGGGIGVAFAGRQCCPR